MNVFRSCSIQILFPYLQLDGVPDTGGANLRHNGVEAPEQGQGAHAHQVGIVGDKAQRVNHVDDDGRRLLALLLRYFIML